ncbi:CGNR zinc finger domain-containing protein [Ochrobactrum sp. Q0168]|uniref:CGNR zinc finger domain-containing protein n=1 Tax=Ochrobactrum sp. Q0168 TaxID=2793241 RepID=UPI0018EAD116|nr:CGNR zinc finger domain-containing protein [Ochrobactrum sp. Q0168]
MSDHDFPFLGNALWVDFLNTQPALRGGGLDELIDGPDAFGRWAVATGEFGLDKPFTPNEGEMQDALRFRAVLREGAESLLAGAAPSKNTVAVVNEKLACSPVVSVLVEKDGGWDLVPRFVTGPAAALLGKIAADFSQTLLSGQSNRLRRCEHPACVMLFIDTSKNGRRRWCSMETCGNREKAASHRTRARRLDTKV